MKFVRKNLKNSHATLVARLLVKAQLQEAALNNDRMSDASVTTSYTQTHLSDSPSNSASPSPHLSYIHPNASTASSGRPSPSPLSSPGLPPSGGAPPRISYAPQMGMGIGMQQYPPHLQYSPHPHPHQHQHQRQHIPYG